MFTNVVAGNYEGKVYLVNPKGEEIACRHVYKSVMEIPDPVDLAVITISASKVLPVIALKGGRTQAGGSHTRAMTSNAKVFEAT